MRSTVLAFMVSVACGAIAITPARADDKDVPGKAVCRTCEVRGATHGEEDVVAWRDHEGKRYHFCSDDCAAAFDAFPAAYVPQVLPRPAPNATVSTITGAEFELDDLRGRVVLLDFWATWCKPCYEAMPLLAKLHAEYPDTNLAVLGVSIDENAKEVVPRFVDKKKLSYPIALDTSASPAWYAFAVASIPAMFLIDTEGSIVAEWRGRIEGDVVREAVEALMAQTPTSE